MRTYGCQMNVHNSERIAGLLDEAGYAPVAGGVRRRPWTLPTVWQLRGVDGSEVGRVQALANAR